MILTRTKGMSYREPSKDLCFEGFGLRNGLVGRQSEVHSIYFEVELGGGREMFKYI